MLASVAVVIVLTVVGTVLLYGGAYVTRRALMLFLGIVAYGPRFVPEGDSLDMAIGSVDALVPALLGLGANVLGVTAILLAVHVGVTRLTGSSQSPDRD